MQLVPIVRPDFDVELSLAYATAQNITGTPVYARADCYLLAPAAEALQRAIRQASMLGMRLRIFDALRPTEAQWKLWNFNPDPEFLADPRRGSPHSRGVAVDLTLIGEDGRDLDMGTEFDAFTPRSHHGNLEISYQTIVLQAIIRHDHRCAEFDCPTSRCDAIWACHHESRRSMSNQHGFITNILRLRILCHHLRP